MARRLARARRKHGDGHGTFEDRFGRRLVDTPPICHEAGGAVCNVAVKLDGKRPVGCRCSPLARKELILKIENTPARSAVTSLEDLGDRSDPRAPCALLKCAWSWRASSTSTVHLYTNNSTRAWRSRAGRACLLALDSARRPSSRRAPWPFSGRDRGNNWSRTR